MCVCVCVCVCMRVWYEGFPVFSINIKDKPILIINISNNNDNNNDNNISSCGSSCSEEEAHDSEESVND